MFSKRIFLSIFVILILSACTANNSENNPKEKKFTKMKDTSFIISLSNTLKSGTEIIYFDSKGNSIKDSLLNSGYSIISSTQSKDNIYFNSSRSNDYFTINKKSGSLKEGNLKSMSKTTEDEGSFFINASNSYVFKDINIGYTDKGYESEFIYWTDNNDDKKQHIKLKGMLNSARLIDGKFYILSNYDDEYLSIKVLDPNNNKIISDKRIPNKQIYFIEGNEKDAFKELDSDTIALALTDTVNQNEESKILLINKSNLKIKKEITINQKSFSPTQIELLHDGNIAIPSSEGKVLIYDKNFKLIKSFVMKDTKEEQYLQNIQYSKDNMYAFFKYPTQKKQNVIGHVDIYNLKKGTLTNSIDIHSKKDWETGRLELIQ
ncbi:hypothetical protein ACTHOS_16030 [Bacillus safensis]|uniref:hypothetical protein n=1 Tax=Bacillus TaxID=1386 RepID=UPI00045C9CCB|nr:hypothetical protein [Bacillus safensis]AWI35558.1 hypothetical protein RS87_02190 [Bacillus safensis FO-36b]KDE25990.1 hypothetical protein BA81_16964 [Bacillus safensis FO-36b]MBQ4842875.1 hypothetical protein [Bacillus safensis]MBQ4887310.1 hypothetical protein [Bacillus safensis]MCM3049877.1 hypothetical protein [Bacillus safensis]